ncbi:hypothetical protein HS088_TW16G00092 [Tripterygium wilfordii]|uniref:Protein MAINTENANCE OF PSII UNDER HIGH LIGHT 1 n=1 Tax=Tripterygium wilfordii TaxID=458696 RepID=A0A7J7CHX3_TRIWF|nr:protein MAINTENANCE OF PSII UNDER HIGH LIGHT 1-like [Tripterygium wilfordii]KAF5733652.1 hypothetical protein HS088_TW16G00092 [Tripterygium wilfordii]
MASASQSIISANTSCAFASPRLLRRYGKVTPNFKLFTVRASSDDAEDCNDEECAPDKEVGKVSMEWVASEKTQVVGTYPPRKRGWTGYVEKDTAGQTNIYSVEPTVYVAESAISSGTGGASADGAENTAAVAAGLGLLSLAAASSILLQVGKNPPQIQTMEYNGPSLSYYIDKFKPPEVIQAAVPDQVESTLPIQQESSSPVTQIEVQSENQPEPSAPTLMSISPAS